MSDPDRPPEVPAVTAHAAASADVERELARMKAIYDRRGERLVPSDGGGTAAEARRWLASRARGDTLEVGIGSGLTIAHYGPDVRLTGIDLSPVMLSHARTRAAMDRRHVTLQPGNAMALDFPDGTFDTVVFCFVLCSVPDDGVAIREARRVLRPGGRFLAAEHVRSPNPIVRMVERLWEPISLRQMGDHPLRDPMDHLETAGFTIELLERKMLGIVERVVAVRG